MTTTSTETCEHGMSASLCAGPEHYPADGPEVHYTFSDHHSFWHAQHGQVVCPWDCGIGEAWDYEPEAPPVRCGNKAAHGAETTYHSGVDEVRACFGSSR